jgi:N4-gp56 family major capsid protein
MANTSAASGLTAQQWDDQFFTEYVRASRFARYLGTDENSIIQVREDLEKKSGDSITFALVHQLLGDGVRGSETLEGNEERLDTRSQRLVVDQFRHGVRIPRLERQFSAIDLRQAGKAMLKSWIDRRTKTDIVDALMSINGKLYDAATEAQRNAWVTDNADRVLFGKAVGNLVAGDHAASLAMIDSVNDLLTAEAVTLLKMLAKEASPKIRPIEVEEDDAYFVAFAGSRLFRDLKKDATIVAAQKDAAERGRDNPLFRGGDILWDGVIVKEVEDIPFVTGAGAAGIPVAPIFLCGAQAVGWAIAQRTKSVEEEFDYGDKLGLAIGEIRSIEKLRFGTGTTDPDAPKDAGIVTGWFAAAANA